VLASPMPFGFMTDKLAHAGPCRIPMFVVRISSSSAISSQRLRQLREVYRQPPRWPPFGDHELDIDDGIGWSLAGEATKWM